MKSVILPLFVVLQLTELAVGTCRLRATVKITPGEKQEQVRQTRLQLLCDNDECPPTNFTTCDTYMDLGISPECTGNGCRKVFNLCENSCINEGQDQDPPTLSSTESPTQPKPIPTPAKTDLGSSDMCTTSPQTSIFCTSATTTITVNSPTISTVTHNSCKPTKIFLPTKAMAQKLSAANTPTACTPCQQDPKESVTVTITSESFQTSSCNTSTSNEPGTKFVTVTVRLPSKLSCTPELTLNETGPSSSTTSLASNITSCKSPGLSNQADNSSTATLALGGLLVISLVLLAIVTAGWMWTCWIARKRGEVNINSKTNNFPNTPGTMTLNNNTDTLRRVQNPIYEETTINGGLLSLSEGALETVQGENEEVGPTYEIIPLPAPVTKKASKKCENIQLEKEETATAAGGRVSVGVASVYNDDSTQDNIGSVGRGNMNHYYLPDEEAKRENSERSGDRDRENDYHLLGNEEEVKEERGRENVYQVVVNPLDTEEDYADPDEDEMNNIYHILEGPTPEWEEESEGEKAERERNIEGKEEERERDRVEEEEPLTEPTAYEIPLVSSSKHNSTVLQ